MTPLRLGLLIAALWVVAGCSGEVGYEETAERIRKEGQRDPGESAADLGR